MTAKGRLLLVGVVLTVGAFPAFAEDGKVTVSGEVSAETCTVNGGVPSFGVSLPTLSTSAFSGPGSTAGATRFSITLSGCTGPAIAVRTYFENGPTINTSGRLSNQTAGGASVDGQIKNTNGDVVNLYASDGSQNTPTTSIVGGRATQNFTIAYYANDTNMTAGAFSSSVVYSLIYQ